MSLQDLPGSGAPKIAADTNRIDDNMWLPEQLGNYYTNICLKHKLYREIYDERELLQGAAVRSLDPKIILYARVILLDNRTQAQRDEKLAEGAQKKKEEDEDGSAHPKKGEHEWQGGKAFTLFGR